MNDTRVLVVWNEVPEKVSFVKLLVPVENVAKFKRIHNHFVNSGVDLSPEKEITDTFYDKEGNFKFEKRDEPLVGQVFDLIIITGCIV